MPNKAKAAAKAGATPPVAIGDAVGGRALALINVELKADEKDPTNEALLSDLIAARDLVTQHDVFHGIVAADPLMICAQSDSSGTQAPFNLQDFRQAMQSRGEYTCGINSFWQDFLWTPTPGVPIRRNALVRLMGTLFKTPTPVTLHFAVDNDDYNPLEHKGALQRVSPEEVTSAQLLAMARDVRNQESAEVLRGWAQAAKSAIGTFKKLATPSQRYWYALQQRETLGSIHAVVHRSVYQRTHEVSRMIKGMRESRPDAEVTAAAVAQAYAENLTQTPGSTANVTMSFVDTSLTVVRYMLNNPVVEACLREMDDLCMNDRDGFQNPFDSHSRLQAILDKVKASGPSSRLVWVCQGLTYNVKAGRLKSLSVAEIKGTPSTGHRGYVDFLLSKQVAKDQLFAWAIKTFDTTDSAEWIRAVVTPKMLTWSAWAEEESSPHKHWRLGRTPAELAWLALVEDVVFGKLYDSALRVQVKNGGKDMLAAPPIQDALAAVAEKKPIDDDENGGMADQPNTTDQGQQRDEGGTGVTFTLVATLSCGDDGPAKTKVTKVLLNSLPEDNRDIVDSIVRRTRQQIQAQIVLLDGSDPQLLQELHATSLGNMTGNRDTSARQASTYVGIMIDVKNHGEASHRPQLRVPPFRSELHKANMDIANNRVPNTDNSASIMAGDVYFIFDGGKAGNTSDLLKPFLGKPKSVKTFTIIKDEESTTARLGRISGIGNAGLTETLHVVSAEPLACKPRAYKIFKGTSAGSLMGPVVMPAWSPDVCWHVTYAVKKEIFTPASLIPVGGQAEDPTNGDLPVWPRDKWSVEPVFFHALPSSVYEEIISAFQLKGLLDLSPGPGEAAYAAYSKKIPYVGICFGHAHRKHLMDHLEKKIFTAMTTDTSDLYEPRLATALQASEKKEDAAPAPGNDNANTGKRNGKRAAAKAKAKAMNCKKQKGEDSDPPDPDAADSDADPDDMSADSLGNDSS